MNLKSSETQTQKVKVKAINKGQSERSNKKGQPPVQPMPEIVERNSSCTNYG